jgi:hypothetical protein
MVVGLADRSEVGAVGGKSPSDELGVTVGKAGVGAAMMQMNRRTSTASVREEDEGPDVTVGKAGVGAAMMQMNRRTSTQREADSTDDA